MVVKAWQQKQEAGWLDLTTTQSAKKQEMGRGYRDSYHTPNDEFYPERLLLLKVSQAIKRKSPRRDTCSNTSSYLVGFTINQLHSDPNNYRLMVIHEEYAFSHFSDPHSLQWSIHCSNVQSLFRQWYLVISENKLHLSNIHGKEYHSYTKKQKWRQWGTIGSSIDWTTAGQTSNPVALFQMHGASGWKGLDGPITATSHTSLSLVTFTLNM